jgi:hypothetical protein
MLGELRVALRAESWVEQKVGEMDDSKVVCSEPNSVGALVGMMVAKMVVGRVALTDATKVAMMAVNWEAPRAGPKDSLKAVHWAVSTADWMVASKAVHSAATKVASLVHLWVVLMATQRVVKLADSMEMWMVVWMAADWAEQTGSQKAVCWADTKALRWADSRETQTAESTVVQMDVATAGKTVVPMAVTMVDLKAERTEERLVARLAAKTVV